MENRKTKKNKKMAFRTYTIITFTICDSQLLFVKFNLIEAMYE